VTHCHTRHTPLASPPFSFPFPCPLCHIGLLSCCPCASFPFPISPRLSLSFFFSALVPLTLIEEWARIARVTIMIHMLDGGRRLVISHDFVFMRLTPPGCSQSSRLLWKDHSRGSSLRWRSSLPCQPSATHSQCPRSLGQSEPAKSEPARSTPADGLPLAHCVSPCRVVGFALLWNDGGTSVDACNFRRRNFTLFVVTIGSSPTRTPRRSGTPWTSPRNWLGDGHPLLPLLCLSPGAMYREGALP
jgi:hypothetical protein